MESGELMGDMVGDLSMVIDLFETIETLLFNTGDTLSRSSRGSGYA